LQSEARSLLVEAIARAHFVMEGIAAFTARQQYKSALNAIFWVLRAGAPWRELPETARPAKPVTVYGFPNSSRSLDITV
jgi:transposase